jgi:hypothetical protein
MYGKGLGLTNAATGIALLTPRHNHVLFILGATLLVCGVAILATSVVLSRNSTASE